MAAQGPKPWVWVVCALFTLFGLVSLASESSGDRMWGLLAVLFFGVGGISAFIASRRTSKPPKRGAVEERGRVVDALVYPISRRKSLIGVIGAGAISGAGVIMLIYADPLAEMSPRRGPFVLALVGALCVLVFGFFFLYGLRGLLSGEQFLALTPEGLVQKTASRRFFPWDAIGDARLITFQNVPMLGMTFVRPELVDRSLVARISDSANQRIYGVDIALPLTPLDVDPEDFVGRVDALVKDPSARVSLA